MNNNILFRIAVLLTIYIGFFLSIDGYGFNYNHKSEKSMYTKSEETIRNRKEKKLGNYQSLEDAINGLDGTVIKEYSFDEGSYIVTFKGTEIKDFELICYRYTDKNGELYKISDLSSNRIDLKNGIDDSEWYDYEFALEILIDGIKSMHYIPNVKDQVDVYCGLWFGDKIKDTTIEKGKFEYSLIDGITEEENIYFWTFELEDSVELLNTVLQISNDPPGKNASDTIHYIYKLKDVRDLLGVKTRTSIDYRMIVYWVICALLIAALFFVFKKTAAMNTAGVMSVKRVFGWIISILLSFILASMVGYYISNPRLVFGMHGINDVIEKLIGFRIPNAF